MADLLLALWSVVLSAVVLFQRRQINSLLRKKQEQPLPEPVVYALETAPAPAPVLTIPITPEYDITAAWVEEMSAKGVSVSTEMVDEQRRAWKGFWEA